MNDHVNPLIPIDFPPNPLVDDEFVAQNGLTYVWDGVVWMHARGGGGAQPPDLDLYVLKTGDDLSGALNWDNPPAGGRAVYIHNGSIQIEGGGVRATPSTGIGAAGAEIQAPLFNAVGDPAGFVFGFPTDQNGGIYKKFQSGVTIREDRDGHRAAIEDNTGLNQWEIIDARGGGIRRQGQNRGLDFLDDDEPGNYASIYQDGSGNLIFRKGNPGFATATCFRTRPGDPARLEILGEPEQPLDATNKAYVDRVATGAATIIGAIDASTGDCRLVSDPNNVGVVPPADSVPIGSYLICIIAGTIPGGEAAGITMAVGDWLITDGTAWFDLAVGNPGVATTARQVATLPAVFGADNVQLALEAAEGVTDDLDTRMTDGLDLKVDKAGDTLTGNLTFGDQGLGLDWTDGQGPVANISTDANRNVLFSVDNAGAPALVMTVQAGGPNGGSLVLAGDPLSDMDAVTKRYVDGLNLPDYARDDEVVHLAGDVMTGPLVLHPVNPQNQWDAVPKVYVDNLAVGAGRMLIGTINATTGLCNYTVASGIPDGPLVPADQVTGGSDIICSVAGTIPAGLPAAGTTMQVGDILISDGQDWIFIALPHIPQTADQIGVIPQVFGANNVQDALATAEERVLPPGGTSGQVLTRFAGPDYSVGWLDAGPGGGGGAFLPLTGGSLTGPLTIFSAVMPQLNVRANTDSEIAWTAQTGGAWTWHYDGLNGAFHCRFNIVEFLTLTPNGGAPGAVEINGATTVNGTVTAATPTLDGHLATKAYVDAGGSDLSGDLADVEARSIARDEALAADMVALEGRSQAADTALSGDIADAETRSIARDALLVPLAGGTMTGPLLLSGNPTINAEAANKAYVDALFSNAALLRGVMNAVTGNVTDVDGATHPLPEATGSHDYYICVNAGTIPSGPAQGLTMRLGDQIYDVGTLWVLVAVGTGGVAAVASEVGLVPNVAGANNVQTGMENLQAQKVALAGDTMTGNLTVAPDGSGVFFNGGCAIYKKVTTGLTLRRHTGNIEIGIENVDGSNRQNILTAATGVIKAGDTMTGALTVSYDNARLNINAPTATQGADLVFRGAGADRWLFHKEGSGAGEDLSLFRNDLTAANRVFQISRATGNILISSRPITFWSATPVVGPPATGNGTSTGTRLQLYGASDAFAIGIEGSTMWFNTSSNFRFYVGSVLRYFFGTDRLDMGNQWITSLRDPGTTPTDAANKRYVDAQRDTRVSKTGDTMTGGLMVNAGNDLNYGAFVIRKTANANGQTPSLVFQDGGGGWCAYLYGNRTGYNNRPEAQGRMEVSLGGWGYQNCYYSTVASPSGMYFQGNVSCASLTNRCTADLKIDIRDAKPHEEDTAWGRLKVRRFKTKNKDVWFEAERDRWGFVAEELPTDVVAYAAPGSSRPETMKVRQVEGVDLGALLAMTVAKVKDLEAEIASLRARVQ
jgi:hypothetical protein